MRSNHPSGLILCVLLLLACGCKSTPRVLAPTKPAVTEPTYPPRPTVASPAFTLFHHANNSFTLVTKEDATDEEIEAIIWQLRDAAHTNTFDKLKISQKEVDARSPNAWFHIYRGKKCAAEKYAPGAPPCGGSYHAAGDYTLADKNWDRGILIHDEKETELWNPDKPYVSTK